MTGIVAGYPKIGVEMELIPMVLVAPPRSKVPTVAAAPFGGTLRVRSESLAEKVATGADPDPTALLTTRTELLIFKAHAPLPSPIEMLLANRVPLLMFNVP